MEWIKNMYFCIRSVLFTSIYPVFFFRFQIILTLDMRLFNYWLPDSEETVVKNQNLYAITPTSPLNKKTVTKKKKNKLNIFFLIQVFSWSGSYIVHHHGSHASSKLDQILLFAASAETEEDEAGRDVDLAEVVLQDPGLLQPHKTDHAWRKILHLSHHYVSHVRILRDFPEEVSVWL